MIKIHTVLCFIMTWTALFLIQLRLCVFFQGDTFVVVSFVLCFGVEILCCLNLMYVFIFLFKFG